MMSIPDHLNRTNSSFMADSVADPDEAARTDGDINEYAPTPPVL